MSTRTLSPGVTVTDAVSPAEQAKADADAAPLLALEAKRIAIAAERARLKVEAAKGDLAAGDLQSAVKLYLGG